MNYWLIFLTGLTTGGLSCLAMQGGLLASVIATQKQKESNVDSKSAKPTSFDFLDWAPVAMFLSTKLVSHIILGFLLGALGSVMTLNLTSRLILQLASALFMFATAMNLLQVHPIFRYVAIQPPRFARKLIKNTTRNESLFAPGLLGILTVFIPCGVTQAMEVIAINTGSPTQGALIMGSFILGTFPIFALIGVATAKFSEFWHTWFLRFAAAALIIMTVSSVNGVLRVLDSPYTAERLGARVARMVQAVNPDNTSLGVPTVINGVQPVTINVTNSGYAPTRLVVKAGIPVELTLQAGDVYSCAAAFTFRAFGINTFLSSNTTQKFTFTPANKGIYTYTCSMGMYSGAMEVI